MSWRLVPCLPKFVLVKVQSFWCASDYLSILGESVTIDWDWRKVQDVRLMAIVFCALALVGCGSGGGDGAARPAATEAAHNIPPEPTPTPIVVTLSGVVWTTAVDPVTNAPQDNVTSYATTAPVIIAAVQVGSMPAGAELTATWWIDRAEVPEATMRVATDSLVREGWAKFQFTREEERRFPLGVLEVRITATGGREVTGSVEIVLP
jgi:hypothetical protein